MANWSSMSGWINMRVSRAVLALTLCVCSAQAQAANEESEPDMALLEFLGEWETEDGEWLDPTSLEDIDDSGRQNDE